MDNSTNRPSSDKTLTKSSESLQNYVKTRLRLYPKSPSWVLHIQKWFKKSTTTDLTITNQKNWVQLLTYLQFPYSVPVIELSNMNVKIWHDGGTGRDVGPPQT